MYTHLNEVNEVMGIYFPSDDVRICLRVHKVAPDLLHHSTLSLK